MGVTGFSTRIDLHRIERRSRRLLGAGYLFSAAVLAVINLTWHAPPRMALKAEKPDYIMHADIIERPAKPADAPYLLPAHRPARKQLRREDAGVSLPSPGSVAARIPYGNGETYPLPREMEREASPSPTPDMQPEASSPKLPEMKAQIGRKLERHFSLEEEGITFDDIDSLGIKGFVIQDPRGQAEGEGIFPHPEGNYRTAGSLCQNQWHTDKTIQSRRCFPWTGGSGVPFHKHRRKAGAAHQPFLSGPDPVSHPVYCIRFG